MRKKKKKEKKQATPPRWGKAESEKACLAPCLGSTVELTLVVRSEGEPASGWCDRGRDGILILLFLPPPPSSLCFPLPVACRWARPKVMREGKLAPSLTDYKTQERPCTPPLPVQNSRVGANGEGMGHESRRTDPAPSQLQHWVS